MVRGDSERQRFTGQERDNETGLDYFIARYYSSVQGRFGSPDSFSGSFDNPQTLNLYAYVQNNPLSFIDPTGHYYEDSQSGKVYRSTHTDKDGNVLAVYNDGDLGIYMHKELSDWDGKSKLRAEGSGIVLMGGTLHWDEFAYLNENGNPVEGTQSDKSKRGRILFGESWDKIMEQIHNQQIGRSPDEVAEMSRNGRPFDIKTRPGLAPYGPLTGRTATLLGKQYRDTYMSAKSVGNFMVGHYAGFMGVDLHTIMNLAGALQQKQWREAATMTNILAGKEYGPAP